MLPRESPGMRIDHGGNILVANARLLIEMGVGKARKTFATRDNHTDCNDTHDVPRLSRFTKECPKTSTLGKWSLMAQRKTNDVPERPSLLSEARELTRVSTTS